MAEEKDKQILLLLRQVKEKIEKAEELLSTGEEEDNRWLKVLREVEKNDGIVTVDEWAAIGEKFGYDRRGLGGFFTGKDPLMKKIAGDKRAMTDKAVRWLKEAEGDEGV